MGARWSSTTKRAVVALFAVAALYIVYRAGDIVRPFVWAGVLAFVLLPVVGLLERRLSLPRTAAAAIVFLGLLAAIIGGGRLLVPLALDQLRDLQRTLPTLVANAQNTLAETADQIGLEDLDALIVNFAGIGDDVVDFDFAGGDRFQMAIDGHDLRLPSVIEKRLHRFAEDDFACWMTE